MSESAPPKEVAALIERVQGMVNADEGRSLHMSLRERVATLRDVIAVLARLSAPVPAREWIPVGRALPNDHEKVDVWMNIYASARSMGMSDAFRVIEAWRVGKQWFHHDRDVKKELNSDYITHWMPPTPPPAADK